MGHRPSALVRSILLMGLSSLACGCALWVELNVTPKQQVGVGRHTHWAVLTASKRQVHQPMSESSQKLVYL